MKHRMFMAHLVFTIALSSTGCGAPGNLRAQAAVDLACNDTSLVVDASSWTFLGSASGCGKENRYVFNGEKWISPLDRAAFDFSCKKEEITTQVLGQGEVGISGCGHKAVYVLVHGKWLMNSAGDSPAGKGTGPTP